MFSWFSSFNFSNPVWQSIVFWLWGFVALGGGLAVVGSFSSAVIQYYISDTAERKAASEVSNSKTIASLAETKAAEANAAAAKANLEIARLKSPRSLSPDQKQHLTLKLQKAPKGVLIIDFGYLDVEAKDLGIIPAAQVREIRSKNVMYYQAIACRVFAAPASRG